MIQKLTRLQSDYLYAEWEDDGWEKFNKRTHELRKQGYRKVDQKDGYLNYYEFYKKKGKKKVITVVLMCI